MEKSKMRKLVVSSSIGAVVGFLAAFGLMKLVGSGVLGDLDGLGAGRTGDAHSATA